MMVLAMTGMTGLEAGGHAAHGRNRNLMMESGERYILCIDFSSLTNSCLRGISLSSLDA